MIHSRFARLLTLALTSSLLAACGAPQPEPEATLRPLAVNYTLADGGFVGKGDVQTLLGFNNKQMQDAHTKVGFSYVASVEYSFECTWTTGPDHNRKAHVNTKSASTDIDATVASDSRRTGQWTGWNLGALSATAPVAEPQDSDCGAEGNAMKTIVRDIDGNKIIHVVSSSGGLYANHNSVSHFLQAVE